MPDCEAFAWVNKNNLSVYFLKRAKSLNGIGDFWQQAHGFTENFTGQGMAWICNRLYHQTQLVVPNNNWLLYVPPSHGNSNPDDSRDFVFVEFQVEEILQGLDNVFLVRGNESIKAFRRTHEDRKLNSFLEPLELQEN